jgi:hypothetical protein
MRSINLALRSVLVFTFLLLTAAGSFGAASGGPEGRVVELEGRFIF